LQWLLVAAAKAGLLRSAHDCSEGGLAVTLAEAVIGGPYAAGALGADVDLSGYGPADDIGLLYGEDAGRVVCSCAAGQLDAFLALAKQHDVPAHVAGTVGEAGGALTIRTDRTTHSWPASGLRTVYFEAIPRRMRAVATDRDGGA
jgi:phosphoribosylformylglycinamidine synthase